MIDLTLIQQLRAQGQHEAAREHLLKLSTNVPSDPIVQYETACVHDFLGYERAAIPFYRAAISGGLAGAALRGALLGLGSTYRALGAYEESKRTLLEGLAHFPDATEITVFLAMTLHNLGEYHEAVGSLLLVIANTTTDATTKTYAQAIRSYAEDLNQRWD